VAGLLQVEFSSLTHAPGHSKTVSSQATIQPCSGDCAEVRANLSSSLATAPVTLSATPLDQGGQLGAVTSTRPRRRRRRPAPSGWRHLAAQHGLALLLPISSSRLRRTLVAHRQVGQRVLAQARTWRSRSSTSIVSSTTTFCSKLRSGE